MTFQKRILWWWGIILAVSAAAVWPAGYFYSLTLPVVLQPEPLVCRPDGTAELGGSVTVSTVCELPLWAPAPVVTVTPPENMVTAGAPQVERAWRWCRNRWTCQTVLRPVRPGAAVGGQVVVSVRDDTATLALPGWTVERLPLDRGDPLLADALPEPSSGRLWWYAAAVTVILAAAGGAIWFWCRCCRETVRDLPVWERADRELQSLETAVREKRVALPVAFGQLTEVVRRYLEERYRLPARVQTTGEFLASLGRRDSPLPMEFRPFLSRFLAVADLVKFARQEPEEEPLLRAVEEARGLVQQSVPAESSEKEGGDV